MKIRCLNTIIIIFLSISLVSSLNITIYRDSYSPRETLQTEITGNFNSLTSDNINIYEQGKVHPEPLIKELIRHNKIYYFYAVLPNNPGNYSLKIEDTTYIESGIQKSSPIIKNFTISDSNRSLLSIDKGFILTDKNFSVKVKALNKMQNVNAKFENISISKTINEESEETFDFLIDNIPTKDSFVKFNDYIVPVFIINDMNNSELDYSVYVSVDYLSGIIYSNQTSLFSFYIKNLGRNISNLTISTNFNASVKPSSIALFKTDDTMNINLTFFSNKNISGTVMIKLANHSIEIPAYFNISVFKINNSGQNPLSCTAIGKVCLTDEDCVGQLAPSLEGACCIGECKKKQASGNNWIYGIILIIILVLIGAYLFVKYRQKRQNSPKTVDEIVRQRVDLKDVKERMKKSKKDFSKMDFDEEI